MLRTTHRLRPARQHGPDAADPYRCVDVIGEEEFRLLRDRLRWNRGKLIPVGAANLAGSRVAFAASIQEASLQKPEVI